MLPDDNLIISRQNTLVKQFRSLHSTKGRTQQRQFLLEGTNLIQAALRTAYPLTVVAVSDRWCEQYPDLWATLQTQVPRCQRFSSELLDYASTTVHGDGVLAIAPWPPTLSLAFPQSFGLLLETLQDPGNGGTILRTAAAIGLKQVWFTADSVDLTHPKLLRSSAGAWFDVSLQVCDQPLALVDRCRQQGWQIVASSSYGDQTYWDVDFNLPTLLLMGNEGAGLSPTLQAQADRVVKIPVEPAVESLNVGIATALLLYEAKRQWVSSR